ncbi:hypothetical protein KR032_002034, partial [Drosophila birchii]
CPISVCAIVEYEYAAKEPDELDLQKGAIIHRIKQMPGGWWQGTLKSNGVTGMFPDNFVRVLDSNISSNGNGNGSADHSDEGTSVQLRDKSATSNRRCKVIYSYTQVNDDELTLAVGDVIEFLGEVEEGWWRGRLRSKVGVFPSNFVQHIEPSPILASKRPPTIGATVATSALTAKASNIASSSSSSSTSTAGTATTTTATTTSKQSTRSRATTAAAAGVTSASSVAEPAAIGSVIGTGAAGVNVPMLPPKPQREYCRVEFPYAPQNDDELELKVGDIITVISTELPDKGWWRGEIRGKVGVFPDNFVNMLAPSEAPPPPPRPRARTRSGMRTEAGSGIIDPTGVRIPPRTQRGGSFEFLGARMASFITTIFAPINEPPVTTTQPQTQRKIGSIGNINSTANSTTSHMTTTNSSNSSTTTVTSQQHQQKEQLGGSSSTTSKVYIKKTGSSSNSTTSSTTTNASSSSSAGRKESFGSRDSLNDILSETGLPTGNVAAQRKSLENKNLDLTKPPGVGPAAAVSLQRNSTSNASSAVAPGLVSSALNKSLENMDEKVKSPPPPVLSKKPSVPLKKTPTGGVPVAGNLLGGKKKNPEGKLTSAVSHDLADGLTASKMLTGSNQLPDAGAAGNLVMRRAATIAVEDTDFDRVERSSILSDMRQGRVKAPKRRPPSAAINVLGESNNNSVYVNGSGMGGGSGGGAGSASELSEDGGAGGKATAATASSDDNSTGEEPQLAKPKPREWEKKKAPWMEELKASQVTRKKTSPSVEPRGASVAERTSKLFAADQAIISSSSSSSTTTKVQSSAVTSSMYVENSTSSSSTTTSTTTNDAIMSRSLTAAAKATATAASSDEETKATRPNSLSIRNQRSVSPLVKSSNASSSQSQEEKPSQGLNNHHQDVSSGSVRVNQLEQRVEKLEGLVQNQQRTIEELVNALKSEAERVKILRSELDKYAQCVTQV